MIKKKDWTYHCCLDFRNINKVTLFDVEPIPQPEDIFAKMLRDTYFSKLDFCKGYHQIKMAIKDKELRDTYFWKLDFCKGYHQIKMATKDKEKTSFTTPDGSFQYTKICTVWYG